MTRKAHVKRLYSNDPNTGDPDPTSDTWIDVMRLDQINYFTTSQVGTTWGVIQAFNWQDDQGEDMNPSRKTHQIAVFDPTNPPNDKPQPGDPDTVTLTVVDRIRQGKYGDPSGQTTWTVIKSYANRTEDEEGNTLPTTRKFTVMKIENNDFGGVDASGNSLDPFQGQDVNFVMKWDDYLMLLHNGATDDTQYVYHEIIDQYETAEWANGLTDQNTANNQAVFIGLRNDYFIESQFKSMGTNYQSLAIRDQAGASPDLNDPNAPNAVPIRTDPLQIIVNVSWGGLAVEFGDKAGAPPSAGGP